MGNPNKGNPLNNSIHNLKKTSGWVQNEKKKKTQLNTKFYNILFFEIAPDVQEKS